MKTPFLKNNVVFSSRDHPNKLSIVLFTNPFVCNMKCYYCHNRNESKMLLSSGRKDILETMTVKNFLSIVDFYTLLGAELLIISGGEPLYNNKFIKFIKRYRKEIKLPIRVDTNGQNPEVMRDLKKVVDGYAIDVKINLDKEYNEDEKKEIEKKLGIRSLDEYVKNLYKSIEIAKKFQYTIIRDSAVKI